MRETKFGEMKKLRLPCPINNVCEVMHFHSSGTSHNHISDEIAICIAGSGVVVVGGERHPVEAGDFVHIERGVQHHMEPAENSVLKMLIGYPA